VTITQVPNNTPPEKDDATSGEQSFLDYAATMPETAGGFLDAAEPSPSHTASGDADDNGFLGTAGSGEPVPVRKRVNVTKKVRRAMNRFKTKISDVPILWFHQQAKSHPEWELDDDEKELIKDSVETVFDVLDIEVEIQPLSWTLTSIWWVLSYPLLAFVFLFLTKKSLTMQADQEENDAAIQ
jgi:hypothetical protein